MTDWIIREFQGQLWLTTKHRKYDYYIYSYSGSLTLVAHIYF